VDLKPHMCSWYQIPEKRTSFISLYLLYVDQTDR
jgi:hypothetical protein